MSVLAGWESATPARTPSPIRRRRLAGEPVRRAVRGPVRQSDRRPAGLAGAEPVPPPVMACTPGYIRRRRLVAALVIALVTAASVVALFMARAAAAGDGVPERTTVVEVRSGESLWELAERVAPGSPPQAVVERIRQLNGMQGSTVHPGQPLIVPTGG